MRQAGHQRRRFVTTITKPAFRRQPQYRLRMFKDGDTLFQERGGTGMIGEVDSIESQLDKDLILLERVGINRCVELTWREQFKIQIMGNQRVPPGRMIGVNDQRFGAYKAAWLPAIVGDRDAVKMAAQERAKKRMKAALEPSGNRRGRVFSFQFSVFSFQFSVFSFQFSVFSFQFFWPQY